jgi:NAD(P)-dependent dehydrogenase (short-subunit alcohol dehydrogenase family)
MTLRSLSLEGKRSLVTGAGTGLGKQMALGLAEAGAELVICGRRAGPLEETAAEIRAQGGAAAVILADITDESDRQNLLERAGRIDVLVNNAGVADRFKPWTESTPEDWREVLAVNLDAPFRLIQLFAPAMIEQRWGRIVNIASVYGSLGPDHSRYPDTDWEVPAYFASKHGLHGVTHYLATRLAPFGVCINSLSPGMFATEQTYQMLSPEVIDRLTDGTPMKRLGGHDDLKAAVVFLASDGAQFVTGQNLIVDGGWTVW